MFRTIAGGALFFCCGRSWSEPSKTIAFVHVNVVDVRSGHIEENLCVVVRGRSIVKVGRRCGALPLSRSLIDGKDKYLIPGLWDMHVHSDGEERALSSMARAGITAVRDMGGNLQNLEKARQEIAAGLWQSPTLLFAGPLLEGPPTQAQNDTWIVHSVGEARRDVAELADAHVDFIKIHDNLSREVYFAIAAAAKERRLPFAGHVSASVSPVEASNAGQASIEHFEFLPKPCLPLLSEQKVPPGCDKPALDAMLKTFARNRTYLCLTLQSFQYWVPSQWLATFTAARGLVGQIQAGEVGILAGTDWSTYLESKGARPGWSLYDELELLVRAGFTPLEALQAATLNPAVFLGLEKRLGTVEPGKTASLVLLRANPLTNIQNARAIDAVFVEGRTISLPQ